MLKIEIMRFQAQDIITTSVACVCDPADCYTGTTTAGEPIVVHSNNCTATNHTCGK